MCVALVHVHPHIFLQKLNLSAEARAPKFSLERARQESGAILLLSPILRTQNGAETYIRCWFGCDFGVSIDMRFIFDFNWIENLHSSHCNEVV